MQSAVLVFSLPGGNHCRHRASMPPPQPPSEAHHRGDLTTDGMSPRVDEPSRTSSDCPLLPYICPGPSDLPPTPAINEFRLKKCQTSDARVARDTWSKNSRLAGRV